MDNSLLTEDLDSTGFDPPPAGGKAMTVYLAFWASALVVVTAFCAYLAASRGQSLSDTGYWDIATPLIEFGIIGFIYLLPALIADRRVHRDSYAIALVNILVGWTIIGWIGTLGWALSPARGVKAVITDVQTHAQRHPLVRDATRQLDRALGGKLRTYMPPPEGIETLITDWAIARDIEGGIRLTARLLLPMGTKVKLAVRAADESHDILSATYGLDSDGWLSPSPLTRTGRPFIPGQYVVRLETLPFEFGVQEDWIVDAVGERGKSLPHSATKPSDPEFPQHGRYIADDVRCEFPPLQRETLYIERLKQTVFATVGQTGKSVEDILRDRFATHPDEQLQDNPWSVEQVDHDRWVVTLCFRRRGRPVVARWELNQGGDLRYLDPDSKALSYG